LIGTSDRYRDVSVRASYVRRKEAAEAHRAVNLHGWLTRVVVQWQRSGGIAVRDTLKGEEDAGASVMPGGSLLEESKLAESGEGGAGSWQCMGPVTWKAEGRG
jgi:hypothetical protein